MGSMQKKLALKNFAIGNECPIVLISGPCAIESEVHAMFMAEQISRIAEKLGIPYIFKSSYDKANRTSISGYRGPGLEEGLRIFERVKKEVGVPVIVDVSEVSHIKTVAKVVDIIQIPAFLCRQTDLVVNIAKTNLIVNVKKGQFLAPWDIKNVIEKIESQGNHKIMLTERGTSFGYNNLVSDMRSLIIMKNFGYPVIFDATHSVQLPGALGSLSGGQSEFVPHLSRAATAIGIAGLFIEAHDDPKKAKSDSASTVNLEVLKKTLTEIKEIDLLIKGKR